MDGMDDPVTGSDAGSSGLSGGRRSMVALLIASAAVAAGAVGLVAVGGAGGASCQQSGDGVEWQLVFSDDFDGGELDTDSWYVYDSEGNAGHGLRRPSAVTVEGGRLVITASMADGQLVSGGMAHTAYQTYGRWEAVVRTDADPSAATSGVILTWPQSGRWPIDGENNIYETGPLPDRQAISSFVHYGADNYHIELTHHVDGTEWHEVAMEWRADRIRFFVDGELSGEVTEPEAIPHVPHHLTIQLDAWSDTMGDPVRMEVDRVRVYQAESGEGAGVEPGGDCRS
jgi:beta-glucanase (GH16 family)